MDKLKKKWGIKSNVDFFIIMVVFSLAGSSILFIKKPIFYLLNFDEFSTFWKVIIYILVIFPIYHINLMIIGTLLGKYQFFKNYHKKILKRLKFLK